MSDPVYETPDIDEEQLALIDRSFYESISTREPIGSTYFNPTIVIFFCVIAFFLVCVLLYWALKRMWSSSSCA